MQTRQQQDARKIYEQVQEVADEIKTRYASVVYRFPILVRINGLQQTLGFLEGKAAGDSQSGEQKFLNHLAEVLQLTPVPSLSGQVLDLNLEKYLWHSRRCLEVAIWYRRFVESVLRVDITEAMQADPASLDTKEMADV